MKNILLVGLGGFLGASSRYLLSGWVQKFCTATKFPIGTLAVNIIGCFVLGLLGGWGDTNGGVSHHIRLVLMVGVLGGFTTFSSFGHETAGLLRESMPWQALFNVLISVVTGIVAAALGYRVAHWL